MTPNTSGPKVRCKQCNDIIQSTHRHDWMQCKCKAIFVDGGSDYLRCGWSGNWTKDEAMEVLVPPNTESAQSGSSGGHG